MTLSFFYFVIKYGFDNACHQEALDTKCRLNKWKIKAKINGTQIPQGNTDKYQNIYSDR